MGSVQPLQTGGQAAIWCPTKPTRASTTDRKHRPQAPIANTHSLESKSFDRTAIVAQQNRVVVRDDDGLGSSRHYYLLNKSRSIHGCIVDMQREVRGGSNATLGHPGDAAELQVRGDKRCLRTSKIEPCEGKRLTGSKRNSVPGQRQRTGCLSNAPR